MSSPRLPFLLLVATLGIGASCAQSVEGRSPADKPRLLHASLGDVAAVVRAQRDESRQAGRRVIVYVGARWCEPCRRFKKALRRGALDGAFPRLDVLEFDLDRDRARLRAAGYGSRMIPLFARPRDDGRASGRRIQGSIKGPGAVGEITPRLQRLLAGRDA